MGHNLALVLTPIAFWVLTRAYEAWRNSPSPGAPDPSQGGVNPQVNAGVTPPDPTQGRGVDASTSANGSQRLRVAEWMRQRAAGRSPTELIRAATAAHGVSQATAKRAWRMVRQQPPQGDGK